MNAKKPLGFGAEFLRYLAGEKDPATRLITFRRQKQRASLV